MRKAAVLDGDRTTTGGYVTGASVRFSDKGKKLISVALSYMALYAAPQFGSVLK